MICESVQLFLEPLNPKSTRKIISVNLKSGSDDKEENICMFGPMHHLGRIGQLFEWYVRFYLIL